MKKGRPTKLNEELTNRIVEFINQGCDQKTACNLAGIPYSCFNEWKQKGSEGKEPYATFLSVISRARDEHKAQLLKIVQAGAVGTLPRLADWKAASWLLSKGWPLEFGDRIAVEAEPTAASPVPPLTIVLSTPDGKTKPVSFAQAEKILCADFTRSDEPPNESELGNDADGIDIGPAL